MAISLMDGTALRVIGASNEIPRHVLYWYYSFYRKFFKFGLTASSISVSSDFGL